MKRLRIVPAQPSYVSRHNAIIAAKNRGEIKDRLITLQPDVALRYESYNAAFDINNLHSITESAALQRHKDVLQSCYKKSTKPLRAIFKAIKSVQTTRILKQCPYCGITLPKTYDHYLPEGRFPEFSAHTLNLIPCCSSCNSTKGERWIIGGNRIFINYYLDPLPDDQYLQVQIQSLPGTAAIGAEFSIVRPASITDDRIWRLIESHYMELKLLKRYRDEVNDEVSEIIDACRSHVANGGHNVEHFLVDYANRTSAVFGLNYWRVVLWKALTREHNFITLANNPI